jgi:hypothetical protein
MAFLPAKIGNFATKSLEILPPVFLNSYSVAGVYRANKAIGSLTSGPSD